MVPIDKILTDPDVIRFMEDPKKAVSINQIDLSNEAAEQPGWYARFCTLRAYALLIKNDRKLRLDVVYATAFKKYRDVGNTEKTSQEMAKLDTDYLEARQRYIEAEYYESLLDGAVDSFQQRHQDIQSLIGLKRQEMHTNISMFDEKAKSIFRGGEQQED